MISNFYMNKAQVDKQLNASVAWFVLGLMKSNQKNKSVRKVSRFKRIVKLHNSQTVVFYKTIMNHCNCSFQTVEKTIAKLIQFKIIKRVRVPDACCWVMWIENHNSNQWFEFWTSFKCISTKEVYKEYQIVNAIVQTIESVKDTVNWDIEVVDLNNTGSGGIKTRKKE